MTDRLPPLSPQVVLPSQIAPPATSDLSAQDASSKIDTVLEEEPYTIKCICNFAEDDGSTIYCETCDTWQHIHCFYPNNPQDAVRVDFAHSCADCQPRPLDRQQAFQRQWSAVERPGSEARLKDRKRPPSKSHKKKPKPTEIQVPTPLPADATTQASAQDLLPAKKVKNSHKSNHSLSSQTPKRSPPFTSAGRASITHGHPPSPATTPPDLPQDFEIHNYSPGFVSLYLQKDVQTVHTNSYANLNISNTMSLWLREPAKLRQETGRQFDDVFQTLPNNMNPIKRPLYVGNKKAALPPDTIVRWQCLLTPVAVEKDAPLVELNGMIGFQNDYSADKSNRWDELSSPLPFVFFHDLLPLYIDTRNEGSVARYVRRSCKPNAVLDTFLSGGAEYHFWLVSDRPIAANEQVTIPWDFRFPKKQQLRMLYLLGLSDDEHPTHDQQHDMDGVEYQALASWIHLILSEYGGCACELGNDCAFVRFHRNYFARIQARNPTKKKSRKVKTHTVSPTSTGHATNSRAASEGRLDDGPDGDVASVSGSSRSKPPSRDITPAQTIPAPRQGSFDTLGILTEPTDRDKRKVAMVEDSFRRMEQHPAPPRKKKRISDGTTSSTNSSKPKTKIAAGQPNGVQYVDAGTSRSKSGSPSSAVSPGTLTNPFKTPASRHNSVPLLSRHASASPRGAYCDVGVQTDPVEGEWYSSSGVSPTVVPRRRYKSLSKRLLENRYRMRQEETKRKRHSTGSQSTSSDSMLIDAVAITAAAKALGHPPAALSPADDRVGAASGVATLADGAEVDTQMPDAPDSPDLSRPPPPHALVTGSAPDAVPTRKPNSPELKVLMPPVPTFNAGVANVSSATTPVSATGSVMQSPFSTSDQTNPFALGAANGICIANPSPVKKKLSLSDYTKSRKAARPPVGTTLKTTTSNLDDPKSATSVDGPITSESPLADKPNESRPASEAIANGGMT